MEFAREEKCLVSICTLAGNPEEEGDITCSGILLGSKGFSVHIRPPSPGVLLLEDESPLAGLKTDGANQRAIRN